MAIAFGASIFVMAITLNSMLKGQTGIPVTLFVLSYAMFHLCLKDIKP